MSISFVAETNIGQVRQVNEDSIWPAGNRHDYQPTDPHGMLFLVADGMGGHGAGDVASQLAVAEIPTHYYSAENEHTDIGERLQAAIRVAHRQIVERAGQSAETANMGTTVVMGVLTAAEENLPGEVWLAWAGDSRAYLLRQGRLQQLTRDHSRLWPLIEAGQISWDELHFHPHRSRITNALIARQTEAAPEIMRFPLEPGDRLLLCSDGLSGEVRPEELEHTLATYAPAQAASILIEKANGPTEVYQNSQLIRMEGGSDNISVILIDIPGEPIPPVQATQGPETLTDATVASLPESTAVSKAARSKRRPWGLIAMALLVVLLLVAGGLFIVLAGMNNWQILPGDLPAVSAPVESAPVESTPSDQNPIIIAVESSPGDSADVAATEPVTVSAEAPAIANETRQPTVTRGPAGSPTAPPTATPLPPPPPSPTPPITTTAVLSVNLTPPTLLLPAVDKTGQIFHDAREVTFVWQWPGELTDDLSFEIRVWLQGDTPVGAHDAKLLKDNPLFVNFDGDQYSVPLNLKGGEGILNTSPDYLWSVGVVRIQPDYEWLGIESTAQTIHILVPDGQTNPKTVNTPQ